MNFNEFAEKYHPVMARIVKGYQLTDFDRAEVVQKSLIHIMMNWDKVDLTKNLGGLCRFVILNQMKMQRRGSRSKYLQSEISIDGFREEDEQEMIIPIEATQEDEAEVLSVNRKVNRVLSAMAADYPEHVKVLRGVLEGKSVAEAGQEHGYNYEKAKKLVSYGAIVLKKQRGLR